MPKTKPILLSGVKPTGRPHVGNYFGALKQFVDLQNDYQAFIMLANYHALTNIDSRESGGPAQVRRDTLDLAIDYLAIGLDPTKTVIFRQSDVPEHTELCWIFNCLTTVPYLMRAHAYKDAETKNKEVSVGTFDYPLLMAADILMYDPDVVPVGADQKQHVEIARDTAEKFNRVFAPIFKLPQPLIMEHVKTVPGLDGQKMSKSYGNTIPLFAPDEEIKKLVMTIRTDSKGVEEAKDPERDTVFALHKLFSAKDLSDLEKRYRQGGREGIGYKESKEILAENMIAYLRPMRARRAGIAADPEAVEKILENGAAVARDRAKQKMEAVRLAVGVK